MGWLPETLPTWDICGSGVSLTRGPLRGGPRRGGTDAGSLPTSGHSSGALSTAWGLLSHHPLYLRSLPITGHHTAVMYL